MKASDCISDEIFLCDQVLPLSVCSVVLRLKGVAISSDTIFLARDRNELRMHGGGSTIKDVMEWHRMRIPSAPTLASLVKEISELRALISRHPPLDPP